MAGYARTLLPWLGFLIAVYAVYGLENALASASSSGMASSASAPSAELAASAALAPRPSGAGASRALPPVAHTAGAARIRGTIVLHDASTGRDLRWPCMFTPENAPAEDVVVDANAWADVATALCGA